MRPLELSVEGFRSYREAQVFQFDGRGLFGIVGPTGAGKSSILDALIYALYGRTPRIGRETRHLINSSCDQARVHLVFEVADSCWEVTRIIRTRGSSQVVLRRQGEGSVEAAGEGKVNEAVSEIVGLDYDAFCSSVTLPQGEFDRFLQATPSDRSKILKRIFRLERVDAMREAAKARLYGIEVELKGYEGQLASLPPEPEAMLEELAGRVSEAVARADPLREAAREFARAEGDLKRAEIDLEEVEREISQVRQALEELVDGQALERLAEDEAQAERRLAEFEAEREAASELASRLAAELGRAEASLGGTQLGRAKELLSRRERHSARLDSLKASAERLETELIATELAQREGRHALQAAESALQAADEELAWARQTHAAHLLRVSLSPGEPCPVCKRPVEEIPPAGRAPGLREAESHREAAAREVRSAGARLGELDRAGAVGFERLEACRIDLVQAMQEMETAEEGLGRLLGFGVDAATEIARREEALSGLRSRTEEARARWEGLGERARRAAEEVEEVARRRRAVAGSLIRVCTRLEVEAPTTEEDAAGLAEAAKRAAGAGAVRASEGERRRRELQGQCSSERTVLEGLRSRLGLGPGESVEEALEQANREVWTLSHRMDELRDSIRIRAELLAKVEQAEAKASLYLRLKADLTDAKFIAYLLDEERRLLARLGSEKLFELTSRYRFDEEGEFQIVDTLHEVTRSPDTLSGGETFLASLALALALAEAVSQGGSRLEALFLDEGFGSLDPLSLDVALEGIENLAAPGRLIGLISHVPGIQARLDDLIVLDRAGDGTTVVIQAEGPIAYPAAGI